MKIAILTGFVLAMTCAEPPPSNSYLPPSPNAPASGYPQGSPVLGDVPEVVAARTFGGFGQAAVGNGFPRNGFHSGAAAHGRFSPNGANGDHGYDQNAAAFGRNTLDDAASEPANYNFGYMVNDYREGTDFGHQETRQEKKAQGEWHVVLPDGRKQTVSYEADERGYKPRISYEDTEASSRGNGYDVNANNGGGYRSNGNNGNSNGYNGNGYHGNGNGARNGNGRNGY